MKFLGIWPEERKLDRASSYKVLIPISLMFFFMAAPQTINLYFIWGDFNLIVDNLSVANITVIIALIKMITFWFNGRAIKILLSFMVDHRKEAKTEEEIKKMTKIAKISRRISIGSTVITNSVVVLWAISRFLLIRRTGRVLFLQSYFPYETLVTPNFEIIAIGQIVSAFYTATTYTAVDTFVAMLVFHVCGQFANLQRQLKNICNDKNGNFEENFADIVKKHDCLNEFANTIEDKFNRMLLMQMLGCTVKLCVLFFQALLSITEENQELLVFQICFLTLYISYILLQIYLYCYIGEELVSKGTEMAYAAYNCNWYNLSPNDARCLIIIMSRAQISSRITAGKFCSFNHVLFSNILKTSMGYLSVLYAMKTKDMESISVLLSNMEKDRKETNAKDEVRRMMRIANICRKISIGCTLTYYMVIILFIILHLIFTHYIGRILIIRSYFPYNIQSTPNYELTIFAQILAAWCTGGVYTSVDTFVATLVFHLCGQLNNLKHSLRDLYSHDGNEIKLKIAKIVKKHNSLNRFTQTIEQKFNVMLLLQMIGCSLQLCVTSFQILVALEGKNGVILAQTTFLSAYLIYILLQIYLYCYIGEKLISESIGIFDAAYECKWYTLPPSEVKSLMIIMIKAKVPLRITAGKFCSFRYQLFCNLTIIGQTMAGYCTGSTYTSVDIFVVILVFHACGQLSNLRQQLKNLCQKNDYEFKTKLAQIVQKHDSLNRFVNIIEKEFNGMLLLQMLGCSMQICVTCFQTILVLGSGNKMVFIQILFYGFYLIYVLLQICLYCYIGEKLISESIGIVDAVYECQWHRFSPGESKSLMIIMLRARIPLHITAGKFCSFSHKLFSNVLLTYIVGRVLILSAYFPYNVEQTPNYQLTIIAQMTASYITGGTYTGVDIFIITIVLHACGQYENLIQRLRNVCVKTDDDFQTKLAQIVKKHNALNKFIETVEEQCNVMLLLQMLCCTLLLCVTCFLATSSIERDSDMMTVQLMFFMVYLTHILLQMFFYCHIGERLLSEGTGIIDAIYECKWYDLPANEARSLILIMVRARIPLQLTAGKFCQFSHNLFTNILKTSMSYVSVLHAVN
ncbi:uncharacterized protein LOC122524980 [Polistes fuscatus]|uniref:uncharacterized protein LOC122524980 n=1 Tax=Polistes fuscatus TaxID=30207 RepID=UPI001CA987B5|nr:uncharacterized protein LOC122524980 [Polistes fuscatus]